MDKSLNLHTRTIFLHIISQISVNTTYFQSFPGVSLNVNWLDA